MEFNKKNITAKLLNIREQFVNELKNVTEPDYITVVILNTKIITVGQILDELGIDPNDL